MRALGESDAFLADDVRLQRRFALEGLRSTAPALLAHAERWRPWRAYAMQYLWMADTDAAQLSPASSPRQKSRASMRHGFGPDSRRRNEAVLTEIRASFDNEEAGPKTQAATARLLPRAAKETHHALTA
jgi:hypothetical protein